MYLVQPTLQSKESVEVAKEDNNEINSDKQITSKELLKVLSEKHKSALTNEYIRVVIEEFLECNICGEKLTEAIKLKKINLEYSFLRLL